MIGPYRPLLAFGVIVGGALLFADANSQVVGAGVTCNGGVCSTVAAPPTFQAQPAPGPQAPQIPRAPARYVREEVGGLNKVCYYDRLGSVVAITVSRIQLCPQMLQ